MDGSAAFVNPVLDRSLAHAPARAAPPALQRSQSRHYNNTASMSRVPSTVAKGFPSYSVIAFLLCLERLGLEDICDCS